MKTLISKIKKVSKKENEFSSACSDASREIVKYFDFEYDTNFYVEHQASDGVVLGDDEANVYAMNMIIAEIREHGKISSMQILSKFRI